MNLGNIIKNAAARYAGTRGTTGRAPGAGRYNAPAGRAPGSTGGVAAGITRRLMGMLKRR